MKNLFLTTLTVSISLAIALGIGELWVRMSVPETMFWPISNIYQAHDDPRIGYTYKRNYQGQSFGVPVSINSQGFRGPEWPTHKADDSYRIVLVGDSVTFGFGVEYEQTFGAILEKALQALTKREVDVINLGVNGYNAEQELAVVENIALPLKPDLIIQLIVGNDHQDALAVDDEGYLRWQHKGRSNRIIDPALKKQLNKTSEQTLESHFLAKNSRLYLFVKIMLARYNQSAGPGQKDASTNIPNMRLMPVTANVADELREPVYEPVLKSVSLAQSKGVKVLLIAGMPKAYYRATLKAVAQEANIPMVTLLSMLKKYATTEEYQQKYTLGWDPHPNPTAHQLYGEGLAQRIIASELIK